MRTIKFRAWDKEEKEMYSWDKVVENGWLELTLVKYPETMIPLQFTGLKDRNGKEIYEGDIFRYWYPKKLNGKSYPGKLGVVKWVEANHFTGFNISTKANIEVIGNVYENPDLLNQGTEEGE